MFEDVGKLAKINAQETKPKKFSSWIFENGPNENYSRFTEKKKTITDGNFFGFR